MTVTVNGKATAVAAGSTVADLIRDLALNPHTLVVELDGRVLKKDDYSQTVLADGGVLELVRFVGGG
ncbi:MAG: sulfur carrier protein ThiS [Thermodesulfobacteriota bacterium]